MRTKNELHNRLKKYKLDRVEHEKQLAACIKFHSPKTMTKPIQEKILGLSSRIQELEWVQDLEGAILKFDINQPRRERL